VRYRRGPPRQRLDADHLIIPGVGIGRIRIGMTLAQAVDVWGPATVYPRDPGTTEWMYQWEPQGTMVAVDAQGIITDVSTYRSETAGGGQRNPRRDRGRDRRWQSPLDDN
jgi:hypothetical protein